MDEKRRAFILKAIRLVKAGGKFAIFAALLNLGGYRLLREALADSFISAHIAGAASYQYWRVLSRTGAGNKSYTAIYEIEMNIGGADQATSGNATSGEEALPDYPDDQAFDDNEGQKWNPGGAPAGGDNDTWVGQDFGSPLAITQVRVKPEYGNPDVTWLKVQADTQSDYSTVVTLYDETSISANSWHTFNL